ncbi:right-handed parallel beta-helix repeat-containing protein [Phenylobacterium sp.]|uniref:right-handed parallel beta-helix repeat-containing protein n=1 Tax=Phenylobacterium sp. TaxID=1871053 RepID=UPI002899DC9E|nr:right-handed parallel beta-helix repeat-containing protein [Phenylobacterium sp.]
MADFLCASAAELTAALGSAKAGDRILLQAGNYGNVSLKGFVFDGAVTIASKDPGNPATLTGLTVQNSENLTFQNLHLDFSSPWTVWNTQIIGSKNIELNNLDVHGSLNGNPADDQNALLIRDSAGVKVTGSEFYEFSHAISMMGSTNVRIEGNSFHDLRSDGVMGAGSSNVQVVGNVFTDFYPANGDHPDAIQFLTRGTTGKAHDILVSGNLITRGEGGIIQGVFITDQIGLGYERVTVTDNVVVGGMYNGIMVASANNVVIDGNVVASYADQKSWIRVTDSTNAQLSNNQAITYVLEGNSNLSQSGNAIIAALKSDSAMAHWVWGSDGADQLAARIGGGSRIDGGAGNDVIDGRDGDDYLRGGSGDDRITGGAGNDDLNGNMGNDTVSGGEGDDWVLGGQDNDLLHGDNGADIVMGNMGNDTIYGDAGADTVRGGQHNDLIYGGDGDDWLSGDRGDDTISGGAGADVFHIFADAGLDVVTDFNRAEGDRVLIGDGSRYTVAQVGGDVVIDLAGARMVLSNVALSSLSDGWIISA